MGMTIDLTALQTEIQIASVLISLGLTTAERIRALFAADGHDDATLDAILAECDTRIARRALPPGT